MRMARLPKAGGSQQAVGGSDGLAEPGLRFEQGIDGRPVEVAGDGGIAAERGGQRCAGLRGLAAMPKGRLSDLLGASAAHITWTGGVFKMPDGFAGRYAYVEIVGPDGMVLCPKLRFGLYLQSPDTYYPSHDHAAEELYLVIGGSAHWQKDDGPFFEAGPGSYIHHKPHQRHAMETTAEPLFALWIWTGDIRVETYLIDGSRT